MITFLICRDVMNLRFLVIPLLVLSGAPCAGVQPIIEKVFCGVRFFVCAGDVKTQSADLVVINKAVDDNTHVCRMGIAEKLPAARGAKYAISIYGPRADRPNRKDALKFCYSLSIAQAIRLGVGSVAFSAIGAASDYPVREVAEVAVKKLTCEIGSSFQQNGGLALQEVRFVLDEKNPRYQDLLSAYVSAFNNYLMPYSSESNSH